MARGTILIADDDTAIRTVLNQALARAGYAPRATGNAATLWRTDDIPFGLAKFSVTVAREEKDADAPSDAFHRTSLIEAEMQAVATGNDAKSELPDQH